jgi:hypothetical protein
MTGLDGRAFRAAAVAVLAVAVATCGAQDMRRALLRAGAINVADAIEATVGDTVSVLEAGFSPDSKRILVHVLEVTRGLSSLWIYRIEDGSLVQNGLRPGWTLSTAAFMADAKHIVLAVERPDPPSYRIYLTQVGSTEWANLTDLVPTAHVKTTKLAPSPDGETIAVLSAAEGNADVVVSRQGETLCETQVYPGFLGIVGWGRKGRYLYVESDMPLDLGLTIEGREHNAGWDESMRQGGKSHVFAIDVAECSAALAEPGDVPDPTVSLDGKWKLHPIPVGEGMTGLFLTPR